MVTGTLIVAAVVLNFFVKMFISLPLGVIENDSDKNRILRCSTMFSDAARHKKPTTLLKLRHCVLLFESLFSQIHD